jgi:tetratricopeptide (TPR) repeat protein
MIFGRLASAATLASEDTCIQMIPRTAGTSDNGRAARGESVMPPHPAVHRTIMIVDVEHFTDRRRTNPHQVIVRDALYEVVRRALAEAGISWSACWHEDRGDGILVLVSAQIPKSLFVDIVPGVLAEGLREHNLCHAIEEQIRLRMALHAGEVQFDQHGVTSAAVNHTFRLVDARPLRTALAGSPGALALITSGWFFEDVVRHSATVDPAAFRPVWVAVKETSTAAWIALPDHPYPPDMTELTVASSQPTARPVPVAMFSMRGDIPNFVGRHDELRILLDTVAAAASAPARGISVHTVDGMPGVGKTTFSVHAAHHLANRFPDGQIFLELYGHSPTQAPRDPADALASLLVATGMDRSVLPQEADDRARLWRDRIAGKKILFVLDDAADHDQLRPLLPGTPDCFVLITSRHRLPGLDGAHALPLDMLSSDQAVHLLLTCAHRDPDMTTDPAAARVVQLCGYLPLAIALAAGRLRSHPTWSIAYLADLLEQDPDRLEHLAVGDRSIRAAFTVSYQHLTAERQRIFTLLGVHPGPSVDAYALAALADCCLSEAHHHLEALHADHLIQETAPGRYQLHNLLRVYAGFLAATVDQADTAQAMRRVLDYYLSTAATADAYMPAWACPTLMITPTTPTQHARLDTPQRARTWFNTELATLTACMEHAAAHPDLVTALAATLHDYLRFSGAYEQAHRIHHIALAAAEHAHDRLGQATTLTNLATVHCRQGDYERARQELTDAHQLFIDLGHRLGQANTLSHLGRVYLLPGDYERAVQVLSEARELFTDLGSGFGQALTLNHLGQVYVLQGDHEHAQLVLDQAHHLFTDLRERLGQANTLVYLGSVHHQRGDWGRAQEVLTHAHQLYTDLDTPRGQAESLLHLGRVRHDYRDYDQALDHLTEAYAIFTNLGDRNGEAATLNSLGDLALDHPPAGDPHALFTRAHSLARAIGTPLHEAHALAGLGRCAHRAHDVTIATAAFAQALAICQRLGSLEAATITRYLAELRRDTDQHPETP